MRIESWLIQKRVFRNDTEYPCMHYSVRTKKCYHLANKSQKCLYSKCPVKLPEGRGGN